VLVGRLTLNRAHLKDCPSEGYHKEPSNKRDAGLARHIGGKTTRGFNFRIRGAVLRVGKRSN
jgi:hypothetical protein